MRERISPVFTLLLALLAILLVVFGTGLINQNLSRPARILIEELPAARDQQVFPPLAGERLIRVGVEEDFAPFSYWQNGRASGFDVDLMLAVAEQEGLQVEFIPAARQELRRMIAEGELDAI
ncbi:MAG TPA: transporter substrate-binding domain-containing protein, partial [Anaerolineaceae bacterium]|nr:transporter substrate-binding domain-containing protein [Anaerolineaceae bacterium]